MEAFLCVGRSVWSRWQSELELAHHRQHMADVALQFWAYRVQAQVRITVKFNQCSQDGSHN